MRQHTISTAATLALALSLLCSSCAVQTPTASTAAPSVGPVESGWGPTALPNSRDYYPERAHRKGITGRVGVVLSVDETGRARHIVVVEPGGPEFDSAAKDLFSSLHFNVPPDWLSTGGPTKLFRWGVIFQFPDAHPAPFEDHRQMVWVTTSRLPY